MSHTGQRQFPIERRRGNQRHAVSDAVAVEEPLEIRLTHPALGPSPLTASLTMRTPGADAELAAGYLYCEGVIASADQIVAIHPCGGDPRALRVDLCGPTPDLEPLQRIGTLTSSCGVCGKTSLQALSAHSAGRQVHGSGSVEDCVLRGLPQRLHAAQAGFAQTGGLHAAGLFDLDGNLLALREDVGRHNALDKLIGQALLSGALPWCEHLILLSGRASFELLQKATMAGASIVAAIGAPSSLAIEQARAAGITLVGFTRAEGFNVYCGGERVGLDEGTRARGHEGT